ncbi:MAG: hypothetical protein M3O62_03330, partial [Pseudomonadota bacterium]|nr:hypothetical protein [Pseudomonadota bacterium]
MPNSPPLLRTTGLLLALLCPGEASAASVRDEFRQALTQAERGELPTESDSAALRNYVLYPDLQATRLSARLRPLADPSVDGQIIEFLQTASEIPAVADLRQAWLTSLADRELWADFLRYGGAQATEPALRCATFRARIANDSTDPALATELRDFWQSAPQMPQTCVPAFDWLKQRGLLTPDVIEQRTRKALESRNTELADWLTKMLPPERVPPFRQWSALVNDAIGTLENIARHPAVRFDWAALL